MNTIELEHLKAFESPCTVQLDGNNAIFFGENGSGKSSLYDAIKLCFHRQKIFNTLIPASVVLPADRSARENDILNSYNHQKNPLVSFSLVLNGISYTTYPTADYDVNLIDAEDIEPRDILEVDTLIQKAFINIANAVQYVNENKGDLESLLNSYLNNDFHEPHITLSLAFVNSHWRVALQDTSRMLSPVSENLRSTFNEAKLRIINLLILTIALQSNDLNRTASHHVLLLDDVVGSMDSANRAFMVKYIHEYLSTYQLLIFTHSASYYNIMHYSFTKVWRDQWKGFHIVEQAGDASVVKTIHRNTTQINRDYTPGHNEVATGNALRQRFEYLVQEFSKLVCVGGMAETGLILNNINDGKDIYFQWDAVNKKSLTVYDLIIEIANAVRADTSGSALSSQINVILSQYNANIDIIQLKNTLSELMIFQKVSMNPTSHSTGTATMTTQNEIQRSIALMFKLEECMNKLVGRDLYSF